MYMFENTEKANVRQVVYGAESRPTEVRIKRCLTCAGDKYLVTVRGKTLRGIPEYFNYWRDAEDFAMSLAGFIDAGNRAK